MHWHLIHKEIKFIHMFRKHFYIVLILLTSIASGQNQKEYSKIKFIFDKTPNYSFTEKGIVGNPELLKKEFPLRRIVLLEESTDTIKAGFIPYSQITKSDIESIKSFLLHQSEKIVGEYDRASNRTTIEVFRNDTKAFKDAKKYLNLELDAVDSKGYIDYNKKIVSHGNENYKYRKKFKDVYFNIDYTFINKGFFQFTNSEKTKCEVEFAENLPTCITPNIVFKNANFGVKQISNIYSTETLESVSYE